MEMEMEMEMQFTFFISITALLVLASFSFMLILLLTKSASSKEKPLPSPGRKLPVIGHLHLISIWVIYFNYLKGVSPHQILTKLAKRYGPDVMQLQLGKASSVIISSPKAAEQVLKGQLLDCADRPDVLVSKILFYDSTDIVFTPYGDYWRHMRKICISGLLSAKRIRSFASIRQEEASSFIKSIKSEQVTDLTEMLSAFACSITCRTVFGDQFKGHEMVNAIVRKTDSLLWGFELGDMFPFLKYLSLTTHMMLRSQRKLDSIFEVNLRNRKVKKRREFDDDEDLIDVLLREQQSGTITTDNIKANLSELFYGGSGTSSATLDWAMVELIRNPRVMAKVQEEVRQALKETKKLEESDLEKLKYLKLVIKETLRMHPPFPMIPRACRQECQVDGYTIPFKTMVMINVWAIGRHPEYWVDPDSFQPERFENSSIDFMGNNFEYIPFGAGRRICPGMNFGLANIELLLAQLLYYFDWKMPEGMNPNDMNMNEAKGITVPRKDNLFLVPTLCNPFIE